jgi:hypothetical protein
MRAVAWLCIVAGVFLAVGAFLIAANRPTIHLNRAGFIGGSIP